MKKSVWIFSGLLFIYVWIYILLWATSNNMSLKTNNFVNETFASIRVFEDSQNVDEYDHWSPKLVDNKWSSPEFPNDSYNKVSVIYWNETTPAPQDVKVSISYISRHSH